MKKTILLITMLGISCFGYAQIDLNKIIEDVTKAEKEMIMPNAKTIESRKWWAYRFDRILKGKIKYSLADSIPISSKNDTIYIYDSFDSTNSWYFMIWNADHSIILQGDSSSLRNLSETSAELKKPQNTNYWRYTYGGFHKEIELLRKWDVGEIKRIGIKLPPKIKWSSNYYQVLAAQVIIRRGQYSIRTIDYWADGFDPKGWDDSVNFR